MKHRRLLILLPTVLFFYNCFSGLGIEESRDLRTGFKDIVRANNINEKWVRISDSPSDTAGKALYNRFYRSFQFSYYFFTESDTAWDIVQRLGTPDYIKVDVIDDSRYPIIGSLTIGYASEAKAYSLMNKTEFERGTGNYLGEVWKIISVKPLMIPGMADESKKEIVKKDGSVRTLAVMDFSGMGISGGEAQALTERLRVELFNEGSFKLLERGMMETILQEQGFQQTGCVDSECLVEVGKLIGVEWMVSGSISQVGNVISVSAKIFAVGTGEIVGSASYDARGDIGDLMMGGMKRVARELSQY